MAINRRTKSFSPYSYNIQYRKPGRNPNVRTTAYINAALTPEEHFVVAKRHPNFNVFVTNSYVYSFDPNCNYSFAKGESKFMIYKISENQPNQFDDEEYIFERPHRELILEINQGFIWINDSTIQTEDEYDYYFDYIVLNNNEDYITPSEVKLVNNKIQFKFDQQYENLKVILYKIEESFNKYDELPEKNQINNNLLMDNKCGSLDVIPVVFNENGVRCDLKYDISPSYISFGDTNLNILSAFLYNANDSDQYYLKYGQNTQNVQWNGNKVTITHNLNAYVKVSVDYVNDYSSDNGLNTSLDNKDYSLKALSKNELEITFNTDKMLEYCVTLFKI